MGKLNIKKPRKIENETKKSTEPSLEFIETSDKIQLSKKKDDKSLAKVQFKTISKNKKSDNKAIPIAKLKKSQITDKYEAIKDNLLKQIKKVDTPDNEKTKEELNFVKRVPPRITNHLIKSMLNEKATVLKKTKDGQTLKGVLLKNKVLSKKSKGKLKKQAWKQKIDILKSNQQEIESKLKREKTVITGDMKPLIESLLEPVKPEEQKISKNSKDAKNIPKNKNVSFSDIDTLFTPTQVTPSRKEKREDMLKREAEKSIPKQSIRNKKTQEDISLFNQLTSFKEFTQNPIEILKKHLNK